MAKFVKGNPGGPGRPALTETQRQAKAIAKELAGEAMDTLAIIMRSVSVKQPDGTHVFEAKNASAAVKASVAIIEHAEGKPKQEIEHSGQTTQFVIDAKAEKQTPDAWQKQHANGHLSKSLSGDRSPDSKPS